MGKAIVSSNVIGNRDCVKDNYNGFLLPMDAVMFAAKCCELIGDVELRQKMGENSSAYFESDFLIDKRIGELESLYKKIGGSV